MIESATSKTSCRLCEIRITARPCSPRRLTSSSTWRVWATPSAAVGSSRITTLASSTSRPWRPRPTGAGRRRDPRRSGARERIVVTDRPFEGLLAARLHRRLVEPPQAVDLLAPEVHVLHDVEVVGEREVLVDDLDPEASRRPSGRGCSRARPSKRISPPSIGWIPAMHLISVDLPAPLSPTRAMTSPGGDVEVHLVERLDRAEVSSRPRAARGPVRRSLTCSPPPEWTAPGRRAPGGPRRVLRGRRFVQSAATLPAQISSFLGKSGSPM